MQLSRIYKRYTLLTLALVLIVGSLSHYLVINYFIHRSADHTLKEYRQNIEQFATNHDTLVISDNPLLHNSRLTATLTSPETKVEEHFRDTLVYNHYKQEMVVYRLLSFTLQEGGQNYLLTLWQATVDTEDLLSAVFVSLVILFLLFFLFSFWLTRWFVGKLWRPFYQTLEQLKEVDLISLRALDTSECRIDEFNTLNRSINRMLDRIQKDFLSQKELTETTSHELQTPLSIVKARLELLQQNEKQDAQLTEQIRSVSNAVNRVIRLNRFMLMIAKINNHQFPAVVSLCMNTYLDDFIQAFEDVIGNKRLKIEKQYKAPLILKLHPQLAEILASNILSNAIRYCSREGCIMIRTEADRLTVSNPYHNSIPPGDLFARFNKSTQEQEATGLGLPIVKSICQNNHLEVSIEITPQLFCLHLVCLK